MIVLLFIKHIRTLLLFQAAGIYRNGAKGKDIQKGNIHIEIIYCNNEHNEMVQLL